ncbi:HAMP domain-containing sensor histidine kinase [Hydrogenimonas sp.]
MRISIRLKLILAFFSIIVVGYLVIVYLFSESESKVLKQRAIDDLKTRANYSAEHLKHHLDALAKEVLFLSRLELMDDLIAMDIDKRVAHILQKKRKDIGRNVEFYAFDAAGNPVVAEKGAETDALYTALEGERSQKRRPIVFIFGKELVFAAPVYASFDESRLIGWLLLLQPLENLSADLQRTGGVLAWIVPPETLRPSLEQLFSPPEEEVLKRQYLYVTYPIGPPLEGWHLGYGLEKRIAFETIEQVQKILLFAFVVMLLLTSALTVMIDRRIIGPVRRLADTASKIVATNDYGMRVTPISKDEVGELAESFNRLMQKTAEAFEVIERQNRRHAQTLVGLMHFFSQMIQSETKEETIERACRELRRLTSAKAVTFSDDLTGERPGCLLLECNLESGKKRRVYGTICIEGATETMAMESRFFEAAARMISLQIERIELLQTTREALRSKTSFFSALSHELRTPLGSILSLTQFLMTSQQCDENAKETLGRIESSASHLLQIINDILTMAKAELGKLEPRPQPCDLVALAEESVEMIQPLAEAKGLTFRCDFAVDSYPARTDPKLFRQIVINLLANSVKYTFEGGIFIGFYPLADGIEIVIEDTGIGIEPEALKEVFTEFYREYRAKGSNEGSGLGLALSKKMAEALHGDLVIESEGAGRGSRAVFTLYVSRIPHPVLSR